MGAITRDAVTGGDGRVARAALAAAIGGLALVMFFAVMFFRDVYYGVPESIFVAQIDASCDGDSAARCVAEVLRLNPGRFRVAASTAGSGITVRVRDATAIANTRGVLVRTTTSGVVRLVREEASRRDVVTATDVRTPNTRVVVDAAAAAGGWNVVTFTPTTSDRAAALDELGFFERTDGLLSPARSWPWHFGIRFFPTAIPMVVLAVCAYLAAAGWFLPERWVGTIAPWMAAALCLSVSIIEIGTLFFPYLTRDVRSEYAAQYLMHRLPGSNMAGGLEEGTRIVLGLGETVTDGVVQPHRMPGYGLFCALAALVARSTDLVDVAVMTIVLQTIVFAAAAAILVAAARQLFGVRVAWCVGILVALLPKQLVFTQADSIVPAVQLLVLAALMRYLVDERSDSGGSLARYLEVNLAFALWFVMRSDVLPGWFLVAAALAWRRWRRVAVPAAMMLLIAVPWALYKRPYRHEFALLPTNTGEVLMLSLCEVPGPFPYECTDSGYFEWARRAGHADSTTSAASRDAAADTVRHWLTYPMHFALMVVTKMHRALTVLSFPGLRTRLNVIYAPNITHLFVACCAVIAAALAAGYERRRTALLAWAVFVNMPLFFVMFESSGRFYVVAAISAVIAAFPLICEGGFYRALADRRWRAGAAAVAVLAFVLAAPSIETWILQRDAVHYWTPLLDPARSLMRFPPR